MANAGKIYYDLVHSIEAIHLLRQPSFVQQSVVQEKMHRKTFNKSCWTSFFSSLCDRSLDFIPLSQFS